MDPRLARKRMRRAVEVVKLDGRMDSSEERAVEPATALGDELGHLVRHVGHCVGGFNVVEDPLAAPLRDEFPTEDLEGALERLCRKILRKGRGTYSILS